MEKIVESFELYGKTYRFETGELAKQATGAVLVTQGETTVLVTAVISKEEKNYDFFPLTVDFMEKMYSVGRIPGGYLKREARPSEKGTLTARMIDRPIRPGFVDGFKREVHIVATTLVCDGKNAPRLHLRRRSAALMIGSAPFDGPAARVRIAHNPETDEFIVNPTYEEQWKPPTSSSPSPVPPITSPWSRPAPTRFPRILCCALWISSAIARVLRGSAALPRSLRHHPGRVAHPCCRPVHRRARLPILRRDVPGSERCR